MQIIWGGGAGIFPLGMNLIFLKYMSEVTCICRNVAQCKGCLLHSYGSFITPIASFYRICSLDGNLEFSTVVVHVNEGELLVDNSKYLIKLQIAGFCSHGS